MNLQNSEYIINLWNAILELSPSMRGALPISSDILARAYPTLNLTLPPDEISYKPDKLFAAVASRMSTDAANHEQVNMSPIDNAMCYIRSLSVEGRR